MHQPKKVIETKMVWNPMMSYWEPTVLCEDGTKLKLNYTLTGSCWVCGFEEVKPNNKESE